MRQRLAIASSALVLLCACSDSTPPVSTPLAVAGFLNGAPGKVDVLVDGQPTLTNVESSTITTFDETKLSLGLHVIAVRPSGSSTVAAQFTLTVDGQRRRNFIAYQAPGAQLSARALEDTGALVPAGKSKVRVMNLAPDSDIDIWRTQPDFQTPIRFQFPFPFNPEPGPYFQSDAGVWHIWITPTTNSNTRLHETGPIDIPSGEKRTVVVVDSAGTLRLRVLKD